MTSQELLTIIGSGETSTVQFKEILTSTESMSREIVAMSNGHGGIILIGIEDVTGSVLGLSREQVEEYDRSLSQTADNLKPPVYVNTEVVHINEGQKEKRVLVIHVPQGTNKPYKTAKGEIYVKQGSNKRLLTENSEIMRLFQSSGNLLADEMEVYGTSIDDVDEKRFAAYFTKEFGRGYSERGLTLEQALKAKRILRGEALTLAGLLFFGREPQTIKPALTIKAVAYYGNDAAGTAYKSKPEDMKGTIPELFAAGMAFLKSNLHYRQSGESFNSPGKLEISTVALEEVLQNALVHRDYYKNAPIRILVFDNRVEIISPGKLPNSLTVEDIKYGNPVVRNNLLVAFGSRTLPYSGLGSGITRALAEQPNIELYNEVEAELFRVVIPRVELG